ncbi:hypothetical protein CsSME_00051344 [Camellia sinensis var. sinensis]
MGLRLLGLIYSVSARQLSSPFGYLKLEKSSGFMASSLPNCPPFEFATKYYSGMGDSCVTQSSFFGGKVVLNQGVWYSVILGFGAFFAVFTSFLDKLSGSVDANDQDPYVTFT